MSLNKIQLIGHLGDEPEIRYMPDGTPTTNISLATSEKWKDKKTGEKRESTEWHRVIFFRGLAEVAAQYLRKGAQIYVEGRVRTRKWTDKNSIDRYITEIIASDMRMLDRRAESSQQSTTQSPDSNETSRDSLQNEIPPVPPVDDEEPFWQ